MLCPFIFFPGRGTALFSSRGPISLSSYDEVQAALAPLPALANGDPGQVFAVADLLHLAEQQHLVAVIQVYLPALVSRTQALVRAMDTELLCPDHFFGAGSNMSAFSTMWSRLVPALCWTRSKARPVWGHQAPPRRPSACSQPCMR